MSDPPPSPSRSADRSLALALSGELRGYWSAAAPYQRFLYVVGGLLVLSAFFHTAVLIATGGSVHGPVSWRKPILFGEGFGLTAISVAWVMTFLPHRRVLGWAIALSLGIANFGEVALVSLQQWRGVPSHFNLATPFDEAVFNTMGIFILFTITAILVVTVWSMFSLKARPSFAWAIRAGLLLLVVAQAIGVYMIAHGLGRVVNPGTGTFIPDAVGSASIFGAAGRLVVPHALTVHAIQILPILAILLTLTSWSERARTNLVRLAVAGYVGLVAVQAAQAFGGQPPLALGAVAAVVLATGLVAVAAAYAGAIVGFSGRPGAESRTPAADPRP